MKHIVVDQNALTDQEFIRGLVFRARAGRLSIVLTDMALIEASKKGNPEKGLRLSLRHVAEYPDGVVSAFALGDLLRWELHAEVPRVNVVDQELTPNLRLLLANLMDGKGPALDYFRAHVERARSSAAESHLDDAKNWQSISRMADAAAEAFREPIMDEMRRAASGGNLERLRSLLRRTLVDQGLRQLIERKLANEGWPSRVARGPSCTHGTFLAFVAYALRYKAHDWKSKSKATNNLADLEYVVPALFCDGFVSSDTLANEMYEDLWPALRPGKPFRIRH